MQLQFLNALRYIFTCWYVFSDTVKSAEEMKRLYLFPVYGEMQPKGRGNSKPASRGDAYGSTEEQVYSRIRLMCRKREITKLYAASDFPLAEAERNCLEKLSEKLSEDGIDVRVAQSVGANSFDTDVLEYICREKKLDFVMLDYNILKQEREPLIRRLYQNGIGVIAGAPLAESLYSDRVFQIRNIKDVWYLARALKNFRGQMVRGRKYRFINHVPGMSGSQVALKYVLDNPMVSAAVFGTADLKHLEENVKAAQIRIPKSVFRKIKAAG